MRDRSSAVAGPLRTLFAIGAAGTLSDGELLGRYLDGRAEEAECAFAALVERHGPMVRHVCGSVLGDPHDAADAFQATFLVLARRAGSIRRAESVGPWLFGVALRVAKRARVAAARRRLAERSGGEQAASRRVATAPDGQGPEDWSALYEELDRLPSRYRDPLVLCHLEGLSHEQAAARLGCPIGTLRTRLLRARDRLRPRLSRRGLAPSSLPVALLTTAVAPSAQVALPAGWAGAAARLALASRGLSIASLAVPLASSTLRSMTMIALTRSLVLGGATLLGLVAGVAGLSAWGTVAEAPRPSSDDATGVERAPPLDDDGQGDPTTSTIEGVVVDERGNPVPGAEIERIVSVDGDTTRADAEGRFRLVLGLPKITFVWLRAIAPDGGRQGVVMVRYDRDVQFEAEAEIVVRPSKEITVRVVGPGGQPEPEATVEIFSGEALFIRQAGTGAEGIARFSVPSDLTIDRAIAFKSGVGFAYDLTTFRREPDGTVIPADPLPESIELALDGPRAARVRVVDAEGRPVAGADVRPWLIRMPGTLDELNLSGSQATRVETDAEGIATFDWLPEALLEPIRFTAWLPGYIQEGGDPLDPFDDPEAVVEQRLTRRPRLSGTVRSLDGSPAPGILVAAGLWANDEARLGSRTDADGRFSMPGWPGQTYTVAVTDERLAAEAHFGVAVEGGDEVDGLDFVLGDGTTLEGRVTEGPEDAPRPGKLVAVSLLAADDPEAGATGRGAGLGRWARTDDDGRYRIRVGPGRYRIGDPDGRIPAVVVEVEDQESVAVDLTIPPPEPRFPLAVVVRDGEADGEPVPGALLRIREERQSRFQLTEAEADEDGRVEVDRFRDAMLVYARAPDGSRAGLAPVDPEDDEAVVALGPSASASGRVLDLNGEPMAEARLLGILILPPGDPQGRVLTIAIASVETDDDGRFTVDGLVPGHELALLVAGPRIPYAALDLGADQGRFPIDEVKPFDLGELVYDPRR